MREPTLPYVVMPPPHAAFEEDLTPPAGPFLVRNPADPTVYRCEDLATLRRWALEGRVTEKSSTWRGDGGWRPLRDDPYVEPYLAAGRQAIATPGAPRRTARSPIPPVWQDRGDDVPRFEHIADEPEPATASPPLELDIKTARTAQAFFAEQPLVRFDLEQEINEEAFERDLRAFKRSVVFSRFFLVSSLILTGGVVAFILLWGPSVF